MPEGGDLIDFYYAVEQLNGAVDAVYALNSPPATEQFEKYRQLLRFESNGVERVIRALVFLRSKHPRPSRDRIAQVLSYFRCGRRRLGYTDTKVEGLPLSLPEHSGIPGG